MFKCFLALFFDYLPTSTELIHVCLGWFFFCIEWKGIPKKSENEVAQNGGAEATHNEPVSPIPKALPVPIPVPMPAPITVPPPQVRVAFSFAPDV